HDPEHSPYRGITARTSFSLMGGYLGGSSGKLGIGPAGGWIAGLRYEMRLTGPTDASLTISRGQFDRLVPDPGAPTESQLTGPAGQSVIFVDGGLQILVTGDKTWNRLAPYVGASLGLAWGGNVAADSSGYKFKAKFVTGPMLGLRLYPAAGLVFRAEGRLAFWRLKYPSSFFTPPARAPSDPPLLDPLVESDTDWTAHPVVTIGLGWAFRI
ncbi:MAG TPA: hypothetical protein VFH97_02325, partial [Gemmatimonadales bacterium]|nr:hypothetical protein [Gemmatimonadales bacterium]